MDIAGGGVLLPQRSGNRGRGFVDLLHAQGDAADRLDRAAGRGLHREDVIGDLFRGLRGLHRERLYLGRDHGKAAAGVARARCLDGGIKCQQISLFGDGSLTTSPIFCAPSESTAISRLVACASVVASCTTSLICTSWLLISAIERDSSSAAAATILTLAEVSSKERTALAARSEVRASCRTAMRRCRASRWHCR